MTAGLEVGKDGSPVRAEARAAERHASPRGASWAALWGVSTLAPGAFRRLVERPCLGLALVFLLAVGVGTGLVVVPRLDLTPKVEAALTAKLGRPPGDDELALACRVSRLAANSAAVAVPLANLAYLWLLALILGRTAPPSAAATSPRAYFAVVVHSFLPPALVEGGLEAWLAVRRGSWAAGEPLLRANLAAWLDPDAPPLLLAATSSLDLFDLAWAGLLTWGLVEGAGLAPRRAGFTAAAAVGAVVLVRLLLRLW
jgi:hypothetical protein